jgi:hypothetical protein
MVVGIDAETSRDGGDRDEVRKRTENLGMA